MSSCTGHFGILLEGWQGNRDASPDEAGDTASLSIFHRDIGIPINFLEESGIVSFWSTELRIPVEFSRGYEASCQDGAGT